MKGEARSNPACPASPLHQVSLAGEHGGIVGHVVVGGEHLHLVLPRVDHKDHVFDGDACFGNIGGKDDLNQWNRQTLGTQVTLFTFVTPSGTLLKTALWSSLGNCEWRGKTL